MVPVLSMGVGCLFVQNFSVGQLELQPLALVFVNCPSSTFVSVCRYGCVCMLCMMSPVCTSFFLVEPCRLAFPLSTHEFMSPSVSLVFPTARKYPSSTSHPLPRPAHTNTQADAAHEPKARVEGGGGERGREGEREERERRERAREGESVRERGRERGRPRQGWPPSGAVAAPPASRIKAGFSQRKGGHGYYSVYCACSVHRIEALGRSTLPHLNQLDHQVCIVL